MYVSSVKLVKWYWSAVMEVLYRSGRSEPEWKWAFQADWRAQYHRAGHHGRKKTPQVVFRAQDRYFQPADTKNMFFGLPPSLPQATLCWRTTRPNAPNHLMSL